MRTAAEGWLQGYITVTTFTIWNRHFCWDSMHHLSGMMDHGSNRLVDVDGSCARGLQASVHDGDPDGEGVVYTRVAEIGLLAALGCGSWLLRKVIHDLENQGMSRSLFLLSVR
mgnify:CR=1 FL=1